jgi:D-beta-D-heptose 7-phosphate kinase/D-beta-D-heptose 1-phosphate adenosyltransferase
MKSATCRGLAAAFRGRRVLVLGDVMLDEYIWGEVRRISPEAPVPVVEMSRRTYVPGGASNTAANVAALGGVPHLLGVVGGDAAADRLRDALARSGIDTTGLCVDAGRATTTKTRIVAHSQQVVRLDCEERAPLSPRLEDGLLRGAEARLPATDACLISDYGKGVVSERVAQQFIRLARLAGKPVVVDPKGADYRKYRGATLVKPNVHEAEALAKQHITDEESLQEVGRCLLENLGGSALLITRGPQGMSLFRQDERPVHVPTLARNVFDVTGAGDTVASTLALGLAAGGGLEESMHLANQAASIVVGKVGTATVTLDELVSETRRARARRGTRLRRRTARTFAGTPAAGPLR